MNVVSIDVCGFLNISLYGCYRVLGDISFLSFYCLYGWCAIHNGFMQHAQIIFSAVPRWPAMNMACAV